MINLVSDGCRLPYTAGADIVSGQMLLVGTRVGVAFGDIANGSTGTLSMLGVYSVKKKTADVAALGAVLYWDDTNKELTVTASGNTLAGYVWTAAGNGATSVEININA